MKNSIIENCLQLVRIDSLTGQEDELSHLIEQQFATHKKLNLKKAGLSLCYFGDMLKERTTLGFFGHLDTVHNQQEKPPYCDESHLFGCGASDMKGGLAVMRELMNDFQSRESRFNLIFVYYHSEEGPYVENGLGQVLDEMPIMKEIDCAFVLEPTNNAIQTGCLGVINSQVHFYGKSCHSARPWLGENAIHKAADFLTRLKESEIREYQLDQLQFFEVINATIAKGGQTRNVIPDQFTLHLNYRFSPTKTQEEAIDDLKKLIGSEAELEITDISPSAPTCIKNKITLDFQKFTDCNIEPKQAWTDIARLSRNGIDAFNYGPGDPAEAHQKNEKIPLAQLESCYHNLSSYLFV